MITKRLILGCLALFGLFQTAASYAADNTLVAHWDFNDGSGTIARDITGNGHDGVIYGAEWREGIHGKALSFKGDSQCRVSIDSAKLPTLKAFTVEAWILPQHLEASPDKYIVSWWDHFILRIDRPEFNSCPSLFTFNGAEPGAPAKGNPAQAGVWQHIVGVWDGSIEQLWVNGVKIAELPRKVVLGTSDKSFDIGPSFSGLIDDVKLYSRALEPREVKEHFGMSIQISSFRIDDPICVAQTPFTAHCVLKNTSEVTQSVRPQLLLPTGVSLVGDKLQAYKLKPSESRKITWALVAQSAGDIRIQLDPSAADGMSLPASVDAHILPAVSSRYTPEQSTFRHSIPTGDITVIAEPQGVNVTVQTPTGVFHPVTGIGPIFITDNTEQAPGSYHAELVSVKQTPSSITAAYRAYPKGISAVNYTVKCTRAQQGLTVELDCKQAVSLAVSAGYCLGVDTIRSQVIGRYSEQGGEGPFRVFWLGEPQCWAFAEWQYDKGNCSVIRPTADQPDHQQLVGEQIYMARLDGTREPLHEVLNLRFGDDLWNTVGQLPNKPTPYAKELRQMICADLWGGDFNTCNEFLKWIDKSTNGAYQFLTIVHDWQTPGYDTNLPEVMPPNAKYGGESAMKELLVTGNRMGRIGLHNNYLVTGPAGGIAEKAGAHAYISPTGNKDKMLSGYRPAPISMVNAVKTIEPEVHAMGTSAVHLDEQGAIGIPVESWAFGINCDPKYPDDIMLRTLIKGMRDVTLTAKKIHQGPVFVETGGNEYLEGYSDCNDYGVLKGTDRVLWPDYKLHRIHQLISGYGMGLYYRYFLSPSEFYTPWPSPGANQEKEDDYRAAEIFYGNGAYLFWYPGTSKRFVLTEIGLVGTIQPYYMFQKIKNITYLCDDGKWRTLAQLIIEDISRDRRYVVREDFENGYTQIVNRTSTEAAIDTPRGTITLPKNSFVSWMGNRVFAFSAYAPGTTQRVDYAEDNIRKLRFINPRNGSYEGVSSPTLWVKGKQTEVSFTPDKTQP